MQGNETEPSEIHANTLTPSIKLTTCAMASQTRVRMVLQHDSGSLIYCDGDIAFHIEYPANSLPSQQDRERETSELSKSFLRQHLIKNGRPSSSILPLFRSESMSLLLKETVDVHVEKASNVEEAIISLYKTLGTLLSTLQQREKASVVAMEMHNASKDGGDVEAELSDDQSSAQ